MKWMASLLFALLAFPTFAADKITALRVDDVSYTQIEDVHVASGGRVVVLYSGGGATFDPEQLPKRFLDSWGITPTKIAASKTAAKRQSEQSLNQAIDGGYFREVEGVIYDLRKPQPSWLRMSGAKILQIIQDGALLDLSSSPATPVVVFLRNIPSGYSDHDTITVVAKSTGAFSFLDHGGYERTIRSYDMGHICKRNQIPAAMLEEGLAEFALPDAPKPRDHSMPSLEGHDHLRAIGSGFFVTKDGYLLTNHHVVKDAERIEVKYQISVPVQPGNSGGPLCDASGQVVGVIVARINDFAVLQASGVMPQNVNYAIKARHALRLLQGVKGLEPAAPQNGKPGNAVKTVENAIAMVMIY